MKKKILNIGILLILLVGSIIGCTAERDDPKGIQSTDDVQISVDSRAVIGGVYDGVTISHVRMIIADQASGIILQNNKTSDQSLKPDPNANDKFLITVKPGEYTVMIIANEAPTLTTEINACKFLQTVRDIIVVESDYSSLTESNMMLIGENQIQVIQNSDADPMGQVAVRGTNGSYGTFATYYTAVLTRILAKVSLKLAKAATVTENVLVTQIWLMHIPKHFHIGGAHYAEVEFENKQIPLLNAPIALTTAKQDLFKDVLIRENIFTPVMDESKATYVLIATNYGGTTSLYTVPLGHSPGGGLYDNYNTIRNNHYVIDGTITKPGDFENSFTINVLPWNYIGSDIGFDQNIVYDCFWSGGTNVTASTAYVYYNSYVEFQFTLNEPSGVLWAASLTNGGDFTFDYSGGAVSQGITRAGIPYKIRIKPKQFQTTPGIQTDFFITVGGKEVDINKTLSGTRYTIYQIPQ